MVYHHHIMTFCISVKKYYIILCLRKKIIFLNGHQYITIDNNYLCLSHNIKHVLMITLIIQPAGQALRGIIVH